MQVTHDLGVGGLPGVVATLARNLDRDRFDVSVLCLNDRGPLAEGLERTGVPVLQLPGDREGPDYFAFRKVARVLRERRVDIVHTHNTQPFMDGGLASALVRDCTLVHTDHARKYPDKQRYLTAEWVVAHFASRIVGVSEHTSRMLSEKGKLPSSRIVTIHNGIEDPLRKGAVDRSVKRAELGVPEDALVIGVGVRLAAQKGLSFLLEALPTVLAAVPRAFLLLAGYGPLRERLEGQARELGIAERVRFLGRRLDMGEVLQVFDLYALPSIWEGLPLVVLEAMAVGCPVVASDVGGVSSAVAHDRTGLLVPPRHPAALARAITELLTDHERRRAFGEQARATYRRRFSAGAMARRYEDLYAQCRKLPERRPAGTSGRTGYVPNAGPGA